MLLVIFILIGGRLPFYFKIKLFSPLVRIGFPSIFGLFAFLIIDYADRQMIERILGLTSLGIYSVGYSLGMVMLVAVGAFATAWSPFFASYINKPEEAREVFGRALTYYVFGFGTLLVIYFAFSKILVSVLMASLFHDAFTIVGLVAAAYMLKGMYLILVPGLYFAEKLYKLSVIEWVAAFVNIGLNIWLIPIFGIVGAALATFVSYLTLPVLAWGAARKYLQVDYEWARVALSSIFTLTASGLTFWLSIRYDSNSLLTILINTLVVAIVLASSLKFILSAADRKYFWDKISR
jgi:O-antigen/teichoic acid export membrane protein